MPIEFRCTQCNRLLRTQDDTAGKQAKCPECGMVLTIPALGSPPAGGEHPGSPPPPAGAPASPFGPIEPPAPGAGSPFAAGAAPDVDNPYASPADYTVGTRAGYAATPGPIVPTLIDVGDVLGRAWTIYKDKWLWCVGATLIVGILNWIAGQVASYASALIGAAADDEAIAITCMILGMFVGQLFALWLNIGITLLFLKVARGQEPSMGDIFGGGPYFLVALIAGILFTLMYFGGLLLLIVPGIILALMFSQFFYLIVDRDVGIIESLQLSAQITRGNKLTIFLLGFVAVGLVLAGIAMCCVGVLFTAPLVSLMWVVAYLAMTGQPTADQQYQSQGATPFAANPNTLG